MESERSSGERRCYQLGKIIGFGTGGERVVDKSAEFEAGNKEVREKRSVK